MKTHRFDGVSFISGLIVTALGLLYLIPVEPVGIWEAVSKIGSWFWPVLLIVIGLSIVVPAVLPKKESEDF